MLLHAGRPDWSKLATISPAALRTSGEPLRVAGRGSSSTKRFGHPGDTKRWLTAALLFDEPDDRRGPGPFVEATEYVGGFWIIDAPDEDAALAWAEQCSAALHSRIEVRALQESPE